METIQSVLSPDRPQKQEHAPFVFIVDDDEYTLRLMSILVRDLWPAARIESARSGDVALDKALEQRPDLLITDVWLPGMNGLDLVWRLRQTPSVVPTKVVVVTGYHDPKLHQQAIQMGADDYLTKPLEPKILRRSLIQLLGLGPFHAHPRVASGTT